MGEPDAEEHIVYNHGIVGRTVAQKLAGGVVDRTEFGVSVAGGATVWIHCHSGG